MWRKGNLFALMAGMQTGAATVENSMEISQKIKNETALSSDPSYGYLFKETQDINLKVYIHPHVDCSVIHNSQAMEAPQVPIRRQVGKKLWYVYTMEYYSAMKKKTLPFVPAWMDLEGIILSEISQTEKDKYHIISLICGIIIK